MVKGLCEVCQTRISAMLPKDNTQRQEAGTSESKVITVPAKSSSNIENKLKEVVESDNQGNREKLIKEMKEHVPIPKKEEKVIYEPYKEESWLFWKIFAVISLIIIILLGMGNMYYLSKSSSTYEINVSPTPIQINNSIINPTKEVATILKVPTYINICNGTNSTG
jgi:hypothetical protein